MKRIVSLIVTLLSISSAYSDTLPVAEIVNIPPTFIYFNGLSYFAFSENGTSYYFYDNVFGNVYSPETDDNGQVVDFFYSSHDVVKEIIFHPQSQATTIGYLAFCYLAALESITFPQGINSIDRYAFQGTDSISTVKVYVTDPSAFCNNQVIAQIRMRLNKPVILIDSEGVEITEYVVPDDVETIGVNAFHNCTGLTRVTIPASVSNIGSYAFHNCPIQYVKVKVDDMSAFPGNKVVGKIKFETNKPVHLIDSEGVEITEFVIPDGVTSVVADAFANCVSLTGVTITPTVTSIGNNAFGGCRSLATVIIHDGVRSIGSDAFHGCSRLASIYNFNPTPQTVSSNTFTNYDATLYVLEGSVEAYQAADVWKDFNIVGVLKGDVNMDHEVDVADFTLLASHLLGMTQEGFCAPLADVAGSANGGSDGCIDIADLTGIANIILHGEGS
ncbi:MAG: leucine-rich repeat protein [Prevotella sp.]|nr:leucine-rich repeat protein [Prevotella sp.]